MAKKNKGGDYVYSTNPDFEYSDDDHYADETLAPEEQYLTVQIDRKKRKGKEVILVTGFVGTEEDLKDLGKVLKQKCGVGGTAKDGEIIIQGNQIKKVMDYLLDQNYNVKRSGG